MKPLSFLILLLISLSMQAQNNIITAYEEGVKQLKARQFAEAETQFTIIITHDSASKYLKMAHIYRGFALNGQRKYEKAILDFNEAIKIDPNDPASYTDRGKTYSYQQDYENAIADFEKVLSIDSTGRQAQAASYFLGRIKLLQFKSEEAVIHFNQLIGLVPTDAEAYFLRGIAKGNLMAYDNSIADYDMAIKYRPNYMEAYANRGIQKINKLPMEQKLGKKIKCIEEPCADLLKAKALGDTSVDDMIYLYCKKCK